MTYSLWICTRCHYAVSPKNLDTHLRGHHKSHVSARTPAQRQATLTEMLKRPWIEPTEEPGRFPAPNSPAIPHLPVHSASPVSCQRFFLGGPGSRYFTVVPAAQALAEAARTCQAAGMTTADFIRAQVHREMADDQASEEERNRHVPDRKHPTEVSPWLELTRWPQYLQGHAFAAVAALGAPPDPEREPLLVAFSRSVERLVQRAYTTIAEGRIHLRPNTYREYRQVWQRLICFAYRSSRPDEPVQLRHQLTTAQLAALDEIEEYGAQLPPLGNNSGGSSGGSQDPQRYCGPLVLSPPSPPSPLQAKLDCACLALSIALLDHSLKGDLFESTVVGFLAVLGVDAPRQTFRDLFAYTKNLSGLVKIAQMLVVERAVKIANDGLVTHPADALDDMRERFLLHGVRAPFGWITRLRTYGKKIQNTTTSLGYIYWSEDEQTLSYRDLRLTIAGLRRFVRTEEETRAAVVPVLALHELQDDPVNNQRGWNFLQDQRNRAVLPTTGKQWLMDRVLRADWLREEFLEVDRFLERLLLLIHVTAGQPGRATEIVSLRHSNTVQGRHRNIFIKHGLVSTVTAYHKGYSVSNSTKIIHRYLPKPVSELVVYYLWLILPFAQSVDRLAHGRRGPRSPFFWARGEECWDSSRLRAVLQREAQEHLQTKMNVLSYRHAAIAISRVHLKCGGFKRDYRATDDAAFNEQATHGSWIAGTVYARGLQEAPGHVEARWRRYRAISQEWYGFLGFETYLGPRKRPAEEEKDNHGGPQRVREYITVEIN
ncbi:hypothetical protein EYZ11_012517 [Aspergillus tanneri]|uniref:Uncharacterized protein n=1 Tax=Aspergillus tanneri TaxID=1220188 RepID=A0A4S3J017_9EURO|nr:hypothetical protein EYZ11_012517 [Aspergillus tanneri]